MEEAGSMTYTAEFKRDTDTDEQKLKINDQTSSYTCYVDTCSATYCLCVLYINDVSARALKIQEIRFVFKHIIFK